MQLVWRYGASLKGQKRRINPLSYAKQYKTKLIAWRRIPQWLTDRLLFAGQYRYNMLNARAWPGYASNCCSLNKAKQKKRQETLLSLANRETNWCESQRRGWPLKTCPSSYVENCFRLNPRVFFASNNVKLHYFVTILTLITSQGSVHTCVGWSGLFLRHIIKQWSAMPHAETMEIN